MPDRCPSGFDDRLLSGYLDGELTQGDEQRVSVHLENCPHCKELFADLERNREATMSTRFTPPPDIQWDELPRSGGSSLLRRLGWWLVIPWLVLVAGYGLWEAWRGVHGAFDRILTFGGIAALVLLFLSVLFDRLRDAKTDRYREVKR